MNSNVLTHIQERGLMKGRRSDKEMQTVIEEIQAEIEASEKRNVLQVSANDLAEEFGVHAQTVTTILRTMGYEYDGKNWYKR